MGDPLSATSPPRVSAVLELNMSGNGVNQELTLRLDGMFLGRFCYCRGL